MNQLARLALNLPSRKHFTMDELVACAKLGEGAAHSDMLSSLRLARERGLVVRAPELVIQVASALLSRGASSEEEAFMVMEQLVEALCRVPTPGNIERADGLVMTLGTRFEESQRVARLFSLIDEASGKHADSMEVMETACLPLASSMSEKSRATR